MERAFLEKCLEEGLSLREIGERVERHPSTVGYWIRKHALESAHREKFAARGAIARAALETLVEEGASLREMAAELDRSYSTVRYWLRKYGMRPTRLGRARVEVAQAREAGVERLVRECSRHGKSTFVHEGRGYCRCVRCRSEAVARWRRRAKGRLVASSGGRCAICGYDTYQGALHFHHLDPSVKRFPISRGGVTRSFQETLKESENCVLLCGNCHAEVEAGVVFLPAALARVHDD